MRGSLLIAVCLLVAASCGDDNSDPAAPATAPRSAGDDVTEITEITETTDSTVPDEPSEPDRTTPDDIARSALANVIDIGDAIAINVATNGSSDPVISWTASDAVRVARLDLDSFELGTPVVVSDDLMPIGHPIERPALSVGDDDVVHVAFTSPVGPNGSVYYVDLNGDQSRDPVLISGAPQPETNLVHMTLGDEAPALAWLEDSTLSVATQVGGIPHEVENVDDLTCDCCNPVPVRLDDRLTVAYRNQERTADGIIRDVYAVTSTDGGVTFGEPVPVADEHWLLDGCPFSGPAVLRVGDDVLITWMDGRQSLHPDQDATTIWVDRSTDGGATFGTDLAVTAGGIHRWSSLVLDDGGTVHLIWETQATDGGISYSSSDDGGVHFAPPVVLIANTPESGPRRAPSAVAHGNHLVVTWVDRTGAHVAALPI